MQEEMRIDTGGEVLTFFLEKKRVKRLNLRVKRDGAVHVSAPFGTPSAAVLAFVESYADLVRRARARLAALPPPPPPLREGSRVYYLGEPYRLSLATGDLALTFRDGVATLSLPSPDADIERAYFSCLSDCFLPVVAALCRALEEAHPHLAGHRRELRLRRMRSMWGNCRPREGRLTFSLMLAEMPLSLIEGVVAHEYAHFLVQSHGERFYRALSRISPEYRRLSRELAKRKNEYAKGQ